MMMRRRGDGLLLFLMMGAAAVPIIVFGMVMLGIFGRQMDNSLETAMRRSAEWAMAALDARVTAEFDALAALADGDPGSFPEQARTLMTARPSWLGVRIVPIEDGTAIDVAGSTLPLLDDAMVRQVADDGRPAVGPVQLGAESFVTLYAPVLRGQRVSGVAAAAVSAHSLSAALRMQKQPQGWFVTALDTQRTIIGHDGDVTALSAAVAASAFAERHADDDFVYTSTEGGEGVYTAIARSPAWGWMVAVGVPADLVEGPMRRNMYSLAAAAALALALTAWVGAAQARAVARRHRAERRLVAMSTQREAHRRLADIVSNFPGVIYRRVLHPDGRLSYPYMSSGIRLIDGTSKELRAPAPVGEIGGRIFAAEHREGWQQALLESSRTLEPFHFEGRVGRAGGDKWIRTTAQPNRLPDGGIAWDGIAFDITDLKQAEARLAKSLAEKEAMLREIHHRVRNNLQVVSSLIQIETFQIADDDARCRLAEVSRRIGALGHVHELLYGSADFARIDCGEHLHRLCLTVQAAARHEGAAIEVVVAQSLHTDLDTAIPLGLIAYELVSEEVERHDHARLHLSCSGGVVTLGVGSRRPEPERVATAGLGSRILYALAAQIDARLDFDVDGLAARLRIDARRFACRGAAPDCGAAHLPDG